jgi:hypothetical protein
MTSEWPPRYFVVEWTTMSAPSSSGRWRYGVAKVLSTTTSAPTACAASAAAAMSITFRSGFVGDSSQTMRVFSSRCSARPGAISSAGKEGEVVALRLVDLGEHAVDAAVDVVHAHTRSPGADEVHDRRRRAEPGREGEPVVGALERGEARSRAAGPRRIPERE